MIENFSLERVNQAPASFDPTKLVAFQAQYMRDAAARREGDAASSPSSNAPGW